MRLTVGILTYNSERMLPDLLASLPAGLSGVDEWHLVIADGASADGTLAVAGRLAPAAAIVRLGANRGFAAAANAVALRPVHGRRADPQPDRAAEPRLRPADAGRAGRPGAGIAVPRLLRGTGGYPSLRRRPTLLRACAEALLGGTLARRLGTLSEVIAAPADYTSQTRADWAAGAVTMMSRDCLKQAGDWDETFFLYSEETEFELRAADAGFCVTFADVNVTHLGGEARIRPDLYALQCANKVRLYGMRHGQAARRALLGGRPARRDHPHPAPARADPPRRRPQAAPRTPRARFRPARPDLAAAWTGLSQQPVVHAMGLALLPAMGCIPGQLGSRHRGSFKSQRVLDLHDRDTARRIPRWVALPGRWVRPVCLNRKRSYSSIAGLLCAKTQR